MKQLSPTDYDHKRFKLDRLARKVITSFGWLVLATFLVLIFHLFQQIYPILKSPSLSFNQQFTLPEGYRFLGHVDILSDKLLPTLYKCELRYLAKENNRLRLAKSYPFPCDYEVKAFSFNSADYIAVKTSSNILEIYQLNDVVSGVELDLKFSFAIEKPHTNRQFEYTKTGEKKNISSDGNWYLAMSTMQSMFWIKTETSVDLYHFNIKKPEQISHYQYANVDDFIALPWVQQVVVRQKNSLQFYEGDRLVAQKTLQNLPSKIIASPSARSFFLLYSDILEKWDVKNVLGEMLFAPYPNVLNVPNLHVNELLYDSESNAAIAIDAQGQGAIFNRITNELLTTQALVSTVDSSCWCGPNLYTLNNNRIQTYTLTNIPGVTTWKALFSPVQYEGYIEPDYIWQTSSSVPYYESKKSIIPLMIGSLKASLLALVVALPLALGAAVYTAYFASERVRSSIKPTIEMLEALPSVVIGFIAAVWLAPLAEEFLLSIIVFLVTLPIVMLVIASIRSKVTPLVPQNSSQEWRIVLIIGTVLAVGALSLVLSDAWLAISSMLWNNNLPISINAFDISKTTLVVAVALGIAISPSIYSLAEDALYEVPRGLTQASFALGATRLQTLNRVVLVVAFPSILSAIMLGFGRAFGETMIVLMVTGNTPIADWNILEGLRAMTANLAVELQESEVDTAHFHTLFLTAGLLFIFTFVVNTGAEILRKRLRKNYRNAY